MRRLSFDWIHFPLCTILILLCSPLYAFSVNESRNSSSLDSLISVSKTIGNDTTKVELLNKIGRQFISTGDYTEALSYLTKGLELAQKINYKIGAGDAYSSIGVVNWYKGENESALNNHLKALQIRTDIGDIQGIGNSHNNIGMVYLNLGDYEKCISNYLQALKIKEEIGDKHGAGNSYNNIGVVYGKQENYEKALEYYEKGLQIREEEGDKLGTGMSYNNIGLVYFQREEYREALKNLLKGLLLREEVGDKKGMADSYLNVGNVYYAQLKFEKALEYYFKAAGIDERIGSRSGIGVAYANIGICYLKSDDTKNASIYLNKALKILEEVGNKDVIKDTYYSLSELYRVLGDFKQAYEYQFLYASLKDTLFNESVSRQMMDLNLKYESEKKDKELIKKDAEIEKHQAETERQRIIRNAFIAGFALMFLLAFFIYRGYRQKRIVNKLLDEKNALITDSINYAKRIQESIFSYKEDISRYLPHFFVFHQPKDIVSGDFYWFSATISQSETTIPFNPNAETKQLNNSLSSIMLAAIDCTGHGVPGAFMSMMAYNQLEQTVKKQFFTRPSQVLNELSTLTIEAMQQKELQGNITGGMDIALLKLIPFATSITMYENRPLYQTLEFAGARNSLYMIRNGEFKEIKADKASVGLLTKQTHRFTNHLIPLQKGDCFYIFTDGFVDQFGGPQREKFYYQPFRDLLLSIHHLNMDEQEQQLKQTFNEWMGNEDQTDDVLVLGFKV